MYPTGYRSVCHRHREPCARASKKYIKAGDRSRCDLLGGDVIYTAFVASVCRWWRRRRFEVRGTRLSSSSMFNASGSHDKTSPLAKLLESARWRAALFALLKRATRAKAVPCIPSGDSHRVVVALDRTANSKRGVPNARERVDGSHRRVDARQASQSRLPSGHLEAPPNDAYLVPVAPLPCPLCEITTHCGGAGGGGGSCGGGAFCG